ncbi:hypothetical protein EWM64_g7596 [Hericium alpestre]|uniref:Uncharacterized protein n=1 Tax=Hericium alpestre TaxID=135208 RepID=A0A4Y9ZNH2_9AGAM|nr:hypothetical protein EWM64_g7596 [Hericium alpestre]
MCMHINKSLKTRCHAIRSAMNKYNTTARAIGHEALDWKKVSTYGSLAKFELLRECRTDICSEPWSQSANRQAANHSLKVERAKEECVQLNVEVRRLATWMRDEEADMTAAIARLRAEGTDMLATEVQRVKACHE